MLPSPIGPVPDGLDYKAFQPNDLLAGKGGILQPQTFGEHLVDSDYTPPRGNGNEVHFNLAC